jgi:hypothetical protein
LSTVTEEILTSFYAKLAASSKLDQATIDELRKLIEGGQRLNADRITAIFSRKASVTKP